MSIQHRPGRAAVYLDQHGAVLVNSLVERGYSVYGTLTLDDLQRLRS